MNRIPLLLILLLVLASDTQAQAGAEIRLNDSPQQKENIRARARFRNGAVELRWYPANAAAFRRGSAMGYSIKRMELTEGNNNAFRDLAVVKPFTDAQWKAQTNMKDDMVQATIQSINAKSGEKSKEFRATEDEESSIFLTYVLATSLSADAAKGAGLMYTDNSIEPGKQYAYSITLLSKATQKNDDDEILLFVTDTRSPYKAPSPQDFSLEEGEGTVKLTWNNTTNKDLFTAYNIERSSDGGKTFKKINAYPFISVEGNAEEIFFTDSVKNYVPYQYRIVGYTPWVDLSEPSKVLAGMGRDKTPSTAPANVRAKGDRSKIVVTWELPGKATDLHHFQVARSQKLEGPFTSLNDKAIPVGQRMFVDEKPNPKEPYYVVYSVDTAGNFASRFSVMASVYDSVGPSRPMGFTGTIDSNGVVKLSWKTGSDNDLVGYRIYSANGKENIYRQLNAVPLNDSAFADTVTMRSLTRNVYYKITAVDYNNNASEYSETLTLTRPDVIAPVAPVIKSYTVEGKTVQLVFTPSTSDDVRQHQLFRTDAAGKKIKLADITTGRTFTDSGTSSGAAYSYTLVATDASGLSTASRPLEVSMEEETVQQGVEGLTARVSDKKVTLQWTALQNKQGSALVLFRAVNDGELQWYKKLPSSASSYSEAADAGKYQYALKVLYGNGAESELSKAVTAETK